jgi:SAM-dependent methyltransferase
MREQEQKSQAYWDRIADADDPEGLHGLLSNDARIARYRDAAEKRVLLDRMGTRLAGGRLLEIGCGGGRWTQWLAPRFAEVVAADISPGMIERARARIAKAGLTHVTLVAASMEQLELAGNFDVVYLGSCLHYMGEDAIDEGMTIVERHTAPGALLLSRDTVSTTGVAFARSEKYGGDDPAIYRPAQWYADTMARHGFDRTDDWPTYVTPLSWRIRKVLPRAILQAALDAESRAAATEVRLAGLLHRPGAKDHRFFAYVKR